MNHQLCYYHFVKGVLIIMLFLLQADVIERLRLQYTKDLLKVVDIVLSHQVYTLNDAHWLTSSVHFCFL